MPYDTNDPNEEKRLSVIEKIPFMPKPGALLLAMVDESIDKERLQNIDVLTCYEDNVEKCKTDGGSTQLFLNALKIGHYYSGTDHQVDTDIRKRLIQFGIKPSNADMIVGTIEKENEGQSVLDFLQGGTGLDVSDRAYELYDLVLRNYDVSPSECPKLFGSLVICVALLTSSNIKGPFDPPGGGCTRTPC